MKKFACIATMFLFIIACDDSKKTLPDTDVTPDETAVGDSDEMTGDELVTDGDELLSDSDEPVVPGCGNGVIDEGEECDGPAECAVVDPERYFSGTAECIDDCTRYNTTNCVRPCEDGQLRCNVNLIEQCYENEWSEIDDCSETDSKCYSSMGTTECRELGEYITCGEIFQCYRTCESDATCIDECVAAGGDNSKTLFAPLQECIDENCDGVAATQLSQCVNIFCRQIYQACRNDEGPVCGNGIVEPGELCDDGNLSAGDGCAADCTTETAGTCGNGTLESPEKCDDGALVNGDGCSDDCLIEYGDRFDFTGPEYTGDVLMAVNVSPNGDSQSSTGTLPTFLARRSVMPATSGTGLNLFIDPHFTIPEGVTAADLFRPTILLAPAEGDTQSFYVSGDSGYTQVTATLAKIGEHVQVWVSETDWATTEEIDAIVTEFDTVIYPLVSENFFEPSDVNADGTISLLFTNLGNSIAGYFSPGDLYSAEQYPQSNERDMIFVSTLNSLDSAGAYAVIAHEFQHLVNNNRNVLIEGDMESLNDLGNLWINEGLSMTAMHLYNGVQVNWIGAYNTGAAIADGQSLTYWEYNDNIKVYGNYALSYLFFQYLYAQGGKETAMFREIIESSNNNYLCAEEAIKKYVEPGLTMSDFVINWHLALFLNEATGVFGFEGETFALEPRFYNGAGLNLRGTGAVFKDMPGTFTEPENKGPLTRYVGITTN